PAPEAQARAHAPRLGRGRERRRDGAARAALAAGALSRPRRGRAPARAVVRATWRDRAGPASGNPGGAGPRELEGALRRRGPGRGPVLRRVRRAVFPRARGRLLRRAEAVQARLLVGRAAEPG